MSAHGQAGWMLEFDECDGGLCEDPCEGLCEDP